MNLYEINDKIGYDRARSRGFVGFAELYLKQCNGETPSKNMANICIYKQLAMIDKILGTSNSEQLYWCLDKTSRKEIIMVRLFHV